MKKLFFTALVAVVAVGGAYATNVYPLGSNTPIVCEGNDTDCASAKELDNILVYTNPATPGPQSDPVRLATYSADFPQ